MHRKLTLILLVLAVSLTVGVGAALAGTTGGKDDPGVTPKSILLGGTTPLTGLASSYASISRGAEAYFKYVNARGGVNGRTITYRVLDDGYNAAQTVPLTRQLVEQDKVFAIFNPLGTESNLAVRPYLNQSKVPQLFVGSGATTFGRDYAAVPGHDRVPADLPGRGLGLRQVPRAHGAGRHDRRPLPEGRLRQGPARRPQARPAAVEGEGDRRAAVRPAHLGRRERADGEAEGLRRRHARDLRDVGVRGAGLCGRGEARLEAEARDQQLGRRDAATMAAASDGGRNKLVAGTISIAYLKDPNDDQWAKDKGMKLYRQILARYAPGEDPADALHVYGMAVAWTAVEAIRKAGVDAHARPAFCRCSTSSASPATRSCSPGIAVKTAGKDHFPIEQMVLQRWQNGAWKSFGGLWTYRAPVAARRARRFL